MGFFLFLHRSILSVLFLAMSRRRLQRSLSVVLVRKRLKPTLGSISHSLVESSMLL